ncbi:MAG: STAS domain-containing protein [Propionibacteriaceae bacterium]
MGLSSASSSSRASIASSRSTPAAVMRTMQPAPDAGSFTSWRVGASVEIQASGDLDMAATFKLEPEVERLLAQDGVRRLVLDLAGVRFIDSAGIGALLSIRERADRLRVEMALTNVPTQVERVLELTGTRGIVAR